MMSFLTRLFRRRSVDREIKEEVESHLAMRAEFNERAGLSREDARQTARRQFGNPASIRETLYDFHRFRWLQTLTRDLKYVIRGLVGSPGVSVTAALTVAVGVGAATGMFGVTRNLILAPPPHLSDPARVFHLHQVFWQDGSDGAPSRGTSYPFYELLSDRARTLETVATYRAMDLAVGAGSDARTAAVVVVSGGFWRTLGVRPALGRFLRDDEAHPATGSRVVVLSNAFWHTYFGGREDAVGRSLRIKEQLYEVVGVAPPGFRGVGLEDVDLWLPLFAIEDGSSRAVTWHTIPQSYGMGSSCGSLRKLLLKRPVLT